MGEDQDDEWSMFFTETSKPSLESLFHPGPPVEDVDFESEMPDYPGEQHDLKCGDCGATMSLRRVKKNPFYGCSRYPACEGKHGARADGSPKGIPGSKADRLARIRAHAVFDRIWKENLVRRRSDAYNWLRRVMGLTHSTGNISHLNEAQCEKLIELCYQEHPKLRTRYSRLSFDFDEGEV